MHRDDRGATLVLAMIFLLVGSLLVLALTNLTGASVLNSNNTRAQHNVEYAAEGAVDAAIQATRYKIFSTGTSCPDFPSPTSAIDRGGVAVAAKGDGCPGVGAGDPKHGFGQGGRCWCRLVDPSARPISLYGVTALPVGV